MNQLNMILFASLLMNTQPIETEVYTQLHEHIYKINDQYYYGEPVHTYLINLGINTGVCAL